MTTLPLPIRSQADTCTYCPKLCRFSCPVAEGEARETVTPWGLMSLLRLVDDGHVELTAEVGEVFFHCTGCLRCQTWCRHDHDLPTAMRHARRMVVDSGLPTPPALRGMDQAMEQHGCAGGPVPSLASAEVFDAGSAVAYFPGCARRREDPEGVVLVGRLLAEVLGHKVALFEGDDAAPMHCCGGALEQAGYGAAADVWRERLSGALAGYEQVVTECGDIDLPPDGPRVQPLIDVLFQRMTSWMGKTAQSAGGAGNASAGLVALHDGCRTGRKLGLHDATRAVVTAALGHPPADMWLSRDEGLCCGAGDHYPLVAPDGAAVAAGLVLGALEDQGAQTVVTGSVRCAGHMRAHGDGVEVVDVGRFVARSLGIGGE